MSSQDIPVVVTSAGPQPTPPATLLALLLASVASTNPGYTSNFPGILIEDVSSTDVGALVVCDTARVEAINSISPYSANDFVLAQLGQIYIGPGAAPAVPTNTSVFVQFSATAFTGPVSIKQIVLTITGAGTWTVPADWNNSNNKIEVIGGGGNGGTSGGGGGAYARGANVSLTVGASIAYSVGTAAADSWFSGTSVATSIVGAPAGAAGGASSGAAGGSASLCVGGVGGSVLNPGVPYAYSGG